MSNNFERLESDEVVSVDEPWKIVINNSTFKPRELIEALLTLLKNSDEVFKRGNGEGKMQWGREGIPVQVLRYGANGWQRGKIRISLEFCPDVPKVQKTSTPNQPETSEPESPLDEIRRMQG
ncbi:hypothetical protein NG791_22505 [Laspinema sp. D1]|uniref:KGK domain-containing protein n=1 Tax=Laspinema palackyanum TaxID=3231601 RepID=UPI003496BB5E|nr:hypothetical protein [Laspinema sp. D2b]